MKALPVLLLLSVCAWTAEPPIPPVPDRQPEPPFPPQPKTGVQMFIPGFVVRELPVKLTSLNNIEYAPDGRLFAGGYDGRFHLLRDTNGDGLEDQVTTFSPEPTANYPLGMAVKDGEPYAVLTDEVIRFRDINGDGVPDQRETVAKGFDDPELVKAPYLNHRRVDSSMAMAFGPDGALYVTMGNAGYDNPYWKDKKGVSHYSPERRRGCLLRIGADGKVEQLASGLRYIMSLQFNQRGDLFGTDQEGATWVPNGNPFDELLHIQPGRHYGFPPRHPKELPNVIDEPSVFDYVPQHQSTCGFRFNGPAPGRGRFGPEHWAGDAIVTGESRGKLWRTSLARTKAGYVAKTELIAQLGMLAVDCAISPTGDLLVCCHTGAPDWGNGPKGEGKLFKISYRPSDVPMPVLTFPLRRDTTQLIFDRKVMALPWIMGFEEPTMSAGRFVAAGDEFEKMRPGYAVVKMQEGEKPADVSVTSVYYSLEEHSMEIKTEVRTKALEYGVSNPRAKDALYLAYDLSGLQVEWESWKPEDSEHESWRGWLPHPDFSAAREFTKASAPHMELWKRTKVAGVLTMDGQLDLWNMLIPVTQPGSRLDYKPEPETVTVVFQADAPLTLAAEGAKVERVNEKESRLTVQGPQEGRWALFSLKLTTPAQMLDVSFHTKADPRRRALPLRRWLVPFADPATVAGIGLTAPEIEGGNWEAGRTLFLGKAACGTCHQLRGQGVRMGPELSNLIHRDYGSVLKDIQEPNAAINPDGIGYIVTHQDGTTIVGTRLGDGDGIMEIAQPGGAVAKIKRENIAKIEPMGASLMPAGLDKALSKEELRDLMTYLLTEGPVEK